MLDPLDYHRYSGVIVISEIVISGFFPIYFTIKAHANGRNKCQQLPTLLGFVGEQCCVRLHGPRLFDRFQTIRNKCQQVPTLLWFPANGRKHATSHNIVGPNNVGCC